MVDLFPVAVELSPCHADSLRNSRYRGKHGVLIEETEPGGRVADCRSVRESPMLDQYGRKIVDFPSVYRHIDLDTVPVFRPFKIEIDPLARAYLEGRREVTGASPDEWTTSIRSEGGKLRRDIGVGLTALLMLAIPGFAGLEDIDRTKLNKARNKAGKAPLANAKCVVLRAAREVVKYDLIARDDNSCTSAGKKRPGRHDRRRHLVSTDKHFYWRSVTTVNKDLPPAANKPRLLKL